MKKIVTALVAVGSITTATLVATTANAQWGGDWNFGGNYPAYNHDGGVITSYNYRPIYDYVPDTVGEPIQTIETTTTVRTVRPAARSTVHRQIVTTQTTTVRHIAATASSRPLYDYAVTTPVASTPIYSDTASYGTHYARPLYDVVGTPSVRTVGAQVITMPVYRYVYQWDRILVVDPNTNTVVQALPR